MADSLYTETENAQSLTTLKKDSNMNDSKCISYPEKYESIVRFLAIQDGNESFDAPVCLNQSDLHKLDFNSDGLIDQQDYEPLIKYFREMPFSKALFLDFSDFLKSRSSTNDSVDEIIANVIDGADHNDQKVPESYPEYKKYMEESCSVYFDYLRKNPGDTQDAFKQMMVQIDQDRSNDPDLRKLLDENGSIIRCPSDSE